VVKILQRNGWTLARINGSHHIMTNGKLTVSVPVHANRDLPIGTLKSIEKDAGVKLR
jgi:predicted RNA binding protein YcfA (HicA-like mRNA interferase family)